MNNESLTADLNQLVSQKSREDTFLWFTNLHSFICQILPNIIQIKFYIPTSKKFLKNYIFFGKKVKGLLFKNFIKKKIVSFQIFFLVWILHSKIHFIFIVAIAVKLFF